MRPDRSEEQDTLVKCYAEHDFFFIHIKGADSAGEDGDFERKVKVIEEVDRALAGIIDLQPDVIIVTGDHSTPAVLKGHSWHPVPVLIHSPLRAGRTRPREFSERACAHGRSGAFPGADIMPLALAHAHETGQIWGLRRRSMRTYRSLPETGR